MPVPIRAGHGQRFRVEPLEDRTAFRDDSLIALEQEYARITVVHDPLHVQPPLQSQAAPPGIQPEGGSAGLHLEIEGALLVTQNRIQDHAFHDAADV
ncbi:MAG: hypothetical protein ACOCVM_00375 [Desulfovibrionaceae bacterium]